MIVSIPQRLKMIAAMLLHGNNMYWQDSEEHWSDFGKEIYLGIEEDLSSSIRDTWLCLGEVKLKEVKDDYAPIGTQVNFGIFVNTIEGKQIAYSVQLTHRQN